VRGLDPLGSALGHPLLVERVAVRIRPRCLLHALPDAIRPALHRHGPVAQGAQDAVADGQVVVHVVDLADTDLRKVQLVGVGDLDGPLPHLDLNEG